MYKVNKGTKKLERISRATFKEIECKERKDLQEWIVSEPSVLGEELLIIQKEFDKFENTNERLDLLAIDKQGNLVVIENKTDDTGRDVVWQAVKYASYCSTLSTSEIRDIFSDYIQKYAIELDAEKEILEFLGMDSFDSVKLNEGNSQRIILVAKEFRKEVLSAAQWLNNYGIAISCVQINLFKDGNEIYLDPEQILPQKETQDYTIKLANKEKEIQNKKKTLLKSEALRSRFWALLIPLFNEKSNLYSAITYEGRKDHWLGAASGMGSGIHYNFLICKDYCGVELGIASSDKEHNKKVFSCLLERKADIEKDLDKYKVVWERLDEKDMSRIIVRNYSLSLYDEDSWNNIIDYLIELMLSFEKAMKKHITLIKNIR